MVLRNYYLVLFFILIFQVRGQLSGIFSVPGTYSSVAMAINDLNLQGVNGAVTINIAANYTETAILGGYTLTATGSSLAPIVFQKNGLGNNPLLLAYSSGTATASSAIQDGIWRFCGSDYITVDGIDLLDNNTNNPATMEFGYGFFKLNATDGCKNNLIKNCVINLQRNNNSTGIFPAGDGSRGIELVNALVNSHTLSINVSNANGSNSYNRFYNNTIQNCNIGICVNGFADIAPFNFADMYNDIGGSLIVTGNKLFNYGGAISAVNASAGISVQHQWYISVSNNIINNNNGSGINHSTTLRGIFLGAGAGCNASITNNTITIKGGAATGTTTAIENASGLVAVSNSITLSGNIIKDCSYTNATSAAFFCIYNRGNPSVLNINGNTLLNNSSASTSNALFGIYNTGTVAVALNLDNNAINGMSLTSSCNSFSLSFIRNIMPVSSPSAIVSISGNTLQAVSYTATNSSINFLYNVTAGSVTTISDNSLISCTTSIVGSNDFIYNNTLDKISIVNNNSIGSWLNSGGTTSGYRGFGSPVDTLRISNNNFSNMNCGNCYLTGLDMKFHTGGIHSVYNNTVANLYGWNDVYGIYHSGGNIGSSVHHNVISGITSLYQVYGLLNDYGTSSALAIHSNTIHNLESNIYLYGIFHSSGNNSSIYKNKIYDLKGNYTANGVVQAISIVSSSAGNTKVYNNLIGDLRMPVANTAGIIGILVGSSAPNTTITLAHNSIYLNASSTGTQFGTSGIYLQSGYTVLKNNLVINNSIHSGTTMVTALKKTNVGLSDYALISDNNIFYAGTPGPYQLIYYSGSPFSASNSASTIAIYKTLMNPREQASATELSPFASTVTSSFNYLKLDNITPTLAESGGAPIAGIVDDYIGTTRNVLTPDIGAWEDNYVIYCGLVSGGTPTLSTYTLCNGQQAVLSCTNTSFGPGITFQWKVASQSGGPYTPVTAGNGSLSTTYTYQSIAPGNYYFVLQTSCPSSSLSQLSSEITVSVFPVPSASLSGNATLCQGENLQLIGATDVGNVYALAGPGSYTSASLNNTIVAVNTNASGIYTLTTSFSGCVSSQATLSVLVLSTPALTLTSSSSSICAGASVSLNVNGATTYTWSTGSNANNINDVPLSTVIYSVTGQSSNTCIATASINIIVHPLPIISVNSGSICSGDSITLLPTGAATYTFSGGQAVVSPTANTSYSLTGTSLQGCLSASPAISNIAVWPLPQLSVTSNNSIICLGYPVTLSVTGASTYSWSNGSIVASINVTPTITTNYSVVGTSTNGCTDIDSLTINVTNCVGINTLSQTQQNVSVYPNPNDGNFKIESNYDIKNGLFILLNALGQNVYEQKITKGINDVNTNNLKPGLYSYILLDEKKQIRCGKLAIE